MDLSARWLAAFIDWLQSISVGYFPSVPWLEPSLAAGCALVFAIGVLAWRPHRRSTVPPGPDVTWKPRLNPIGVPGRRRAGLVLLIHGLKGSPDTSFGQFRQLLKRDPEIRAGYDVRAFEYRGGWLELTRPPHPNDVARQLETTIDYQFRDYTDIVILAHSFGGLIARRYIANVLNASQPLRVSRVVYFAVPHLGALGAKLGGLLTSVTSTVLTTASGGWISHGLLKVLGWSPSEQVNALAYDSSFLQSLALDEKRVGAHEKVWVKQVIAEHDGVAGTTSVWGPNGPSDFEIVPDTDHSSLVKPTDTNHLSFKIVRHVLLNATVARPWAAATDHRQPDLKLHPKQTGADYHRNRFVYWNQVLPFFGRDEEQQGLAAFLGDPERRFRWLLVSGPGGIGKSRLALELVLAQVNVWWNAGFLDPVQRSAPDWALWQPRLPTLMIVDYAARKAELVADMLKGLAGREEPHLLRYPVRVVLIERDPEGPWLDTITGPRHVAGEARAPDLALRPINDVWPIFQHVLGEGAAAKAGREATLEKLTEVDKEQRPLFAHLMADAMKNGRDVRHWDREALLREVIQRDRREFWLPAARHAGLVGTAKAIAKEERALALATMVAGLPHNLLGIDDTGLLPRWDLDHHPQLFAAMTGADDRDGIRPLEPDIVGEFFVLETLKALAQKNAAILVARAWSTQPEEVWWFVSRCAADFPNHPSFKATYAVNPRTVEAVCWARAAVNLIYHLRAADLPEAQRLHDEMSLLAGDLQHEPILRELWAKAGVNLVDQLGSANLPLARRLHLDMKALFVAHENEPALRESWAKAGRNLIYDLCSKDPSEAKRLEATRLYDEVKALADAYEKEPVLREQAEAALDLLNGSFQTMWSGETNLS